jgi:toxoflavin synthase
VNQPLHFDLLADKYAAFVAADPIRLNLHYPSVRKALPDLNGKHLLDIGCGDGLFGRLLAQAYRCRITGYDLSPSLIESARHASSSHREINYYVSNPAEFTLGLDKADYATAIMVLPYSRNQTELCDFFRSARTNIKPGGIFAGVVFNPTFDKFGVQIANRRFESIGENSIQVNFLGLNSGEVCLQSELTRFSKTDYELAALDSSFSSLHWISLVPDDEGIKTLGSIFWRNCIDHQPYALLLCS